MTIEKKLITHSNKGESILEDFIYLTNKVIGLDNNSSIEHLNYKFNLQDKMKNKYKINTNELFYNIGIMSRYLLENKYK